MTQPGRPSIPATDDGPEAVFVACGLTKTYRMGDVEVQALRGVDLDLYAAEVAVLLGPSGSGKSTLLNILGGLDTPTSGKVHYRKQDLFGADDEVLTRYRREHVGFVFQFYNLIPSLTARENVELVTDIAEHPMPAERSALGDGYRVHARVVVWQKTDTVRVPLSAIFRDGDGWAVFAIEGDRAHKRLIAIGHRGDREAEVLSGIAEGDRVVVHPGDRLTDGAGVKPLGR